MDKYQKPKFSWFSGSLAERLVQFLCYVLAAVLVSLAFAPFFK